MNVHNSSYPSINGLTCKPMRKGQLCFLLTLSPRLYAFLNKGIFESRLNSNNSYLDNTSLQKLEIAKNSALVMSYARILHFLLQPEQSH